MLTKTKKNRKNLKIENFDKKRKNVWRYGGEGATHRIWPGSMAAVSEKLEFTDDGRTDGHTTDDGRLRHDSSSAV